MEKNLNLFFKYKWFSNRKLYIDFPNRNALH